MVNERETCVAALPAPIGCLLSAYVGRGHGQPKRVRTGMIQPNSIAEKTVPGQTYRIGYCDSTMAVTHGHGNPNWTRDETILALDLYLQLGGAIPAGEDQRIQSLSETLRALPYHAIASRKPSFRNPDGVSFKLQNLRQVATGQGLDNTSKMDSLVWAEFGNDHKRVRKAAEQILQAAKSLEALETVEEDLDEFEEGRAITALHKKRERDGRVRKQLLKLRRALGTLRCEMCGVTGATRVPGYEDSIFEAHHIRPLSAEGLRITRMRDMALLCANCHRLLHRAISTQRRWISVSEARETLISPRHFGEAIGQISNADSPSRTLAL